MKLFFFKVVLFFSLVSCSNIVFLVDTKDQNNFLKNKTLINVVGWSNPVLKDGLYLRLGEATDKRFILNATVVEKQTKRSINENQVAQKIDYKISIDYVLNNILGSCPEIKKSQISSFSFTPKSSGYNFASDILLQNLYKEEIFNSVDSFISFSNNELKSLDCLNED